MVDMYESLTKLPVNYFEIKSALWDFACQNSVLRQDTLDLFVSKQRLASSVQNELFSQFTFFEIFEFRVQNTRLRNRDNPSLQLEIAC